MDLCVMIEGQEDVTWQQWHALAAACDEYGIPALFRSDHYLSVDGGPGPRGSLDAWGTVCALSALTSNVRLGTLVSPATFRHPSVLAKLALTADHISGGRVDLGLGAGWLEAEHRAFGFPFADLRTRFDVLSEQLAIVRGLLGDEPFAFDGEHYRLERVDALPKPTRGRLPIIVGGDAGPRSAALAARFADEYNTLYARADEVRARRAAVVDAWTAAGRDPDTLRFSLMTGLLVGRDDAELRDRAGRLAERRGTGRSAQDELDAAHPAWIVGTVDAAAAQLRALADAGVDRVMLQLHLHEEIDQLQIIGRELAAAVS